jgi:hypothetical protein
MLSIWWKVPGIQLAEAGSILTFAFAANGENAASMATKGRVMRNVVSKD